MRDNHKSEEYFKEFSNQNTNEINMILIQNHKLEQQGVPTGRHSMLLKLQYEELLTQFSLGTKKNQLEKLYVDLLENAKKVTDFTYNEIIYLISLGVLFDYDPSSYLEIGIQQHLDFYLSLFLDYFDYPMLPPVLDTKFDTYKIISDITKKNFSKVEFEKELLNYLMNTWYDTRKNTYWYDTLSTSNHHYFGYWALDVMALAKIYGVDTTRLVQSDYFALL